MPEPVRTPLLGAVLGVSLSWGTWPPESGDLNRMGVQMGKEGWLRRSFTNSIDDYCNTNYDKHRDPRELCAVRERKGEHRKVMDQERPSWGSERRVRTEPGQRVAGRAFQAEETIWQYDVAWKHWEGVREGRMGNGVAGIGGEGARCVERILPAPWEGVWFVS